MSQTSSGGLLESACVQDTVQSHWPHTNGRSLAELDHLPEGYTGRGEFGKVSYVALYGEGVGSVKEPWWSCDSFWAGSVAHHEPLGLPPRHVCCLLWSPTVPWKEYVSTMVTPLKLSFPQIKSRARDGPGEGGFRRVYEV